MFILIGAVLMFIILKLLTKGKPIPDDKTSENFQLLLGTKEAHELIRTPQFADVLMTKEFKNLAAGIADKYIMDIAKKLV